MEMKLGMSGAPFKVVPQLVEEKMLDAIIAVANMPYFSGKDAFVM